MALSVNIVNSEGAPLGTLDGESDGILLGVPEGVSVGWTVG